MRRHWIARINNNRFVVLLATLLIFLILNPFMVETHIEAYAYGGLFSIMLFVCVYIVHHSRWLIMPALILSIIIILGFWASNLTNAPRYIILLEYILSGIFFCIITSTIISYVLHHKQITFNTLCGAISSYLMLGLSWCFIYIIIYYFSHNAFNIPKQELKHFDIFLQDFLYYSYVTLSTLGYGDITPLSRIAKSFATLEAITGQIYLTVWIARLVGLHISQRRSRSHQDENYAE